MRKKLFFTATLISIIIQTASCGLVNKEKNNNIDNNSTVAIKTNNKISQKQISGEWTIVSVYGKKVNAEDMPFLNFNTEDSRIYGNSGCNVINGSYTCKENNSLSFGNVLTSLMMCQNIKLETSILKAIGETSEYSISTKNGELNMNLIDKRGSNIMQLKQHNLDNLNGTWTVKEIDGVKVKDKNVQLVIDIQELRLHGRTGCNVINGQILLDSKKNKAIQFSRIISTRMSCPDMKIETALLVALEEVEFYNQSNSSNQITFFDNKKEKVLILERINLK